MPLYFPVWDCSEGLRAYSPDTHTVTKGQEEEGKDEFLRFSFASAQRQVFHFFRPVDSLKPVQ